MNALSLRVGSAWSLDWRLEDETQVAPLEAELLASRQVQAELEAWIAAWPSSSRRGGSGPGLGV